MNTVMVNTITLLNFKKIQFTTLCLLLPFIAFCQWNWMNPLPQRNTLNSIQFVNPSTGYAAGDGGTIFAPLRNGNVYFESIKPYTIQYIQTISYNLILRIYEP